MKATRPARLLAAVVDLLDAWWGLIGLAIVVALEIFVFGPRGQTTLMLVAGIVGAGLLLGWMAGGSGWGGGPPPIR